MQNKQRMLAVGLTACLILSMTGCENAGEGYAHQNENVEYIRQRAWDQGNYDAPDSDEYGYDYDGGEYGDYDDDSDFGGSYDNGYEEAYEEEIPGQEYFGFEENADIEEKVVNAWTYIKNDIGSMQISSLAAQTEVTDDTLRWINGTYAVWTKTFDGDLDLIGGMEEGPEAKMIWKEILERDWSIEGKADVSSQLLWLLEEGHRAYFRQGVADLEDNGVISMLLSMSEEDLQAELETASEDEKSSMYMTLAACRAYQAEGMHGIDAWDYVRGIQVAAMAYLAGYYSLEETLDVSYLFAQIIQAKWGSWDEMLDNYLYGYDFFAADDPEEEGSQAYIRRQYAQELKADAAGPYQVDWNLELTPGWN